MKFASRSASQATTTIGRVRGSGDGWTTCGLGHRHWGVFGAAGLLLRRGPNRDAELVLQLRSTQSHHGGTWGIPGGARDEGESAVQAALRESAEEAGIAATDLSPEGTFVDDHGGWAYTTVIATAVGDPKPRPVDHESDAVRWARPEETSRLPLHHGFARTWPRLREIGVAPVMLIDAANTIGSRPDGWWRDRSGAVGRLRDEVGQAMSSGLAEETLAGWLGREPVVGLHWFPRMIMITEGAAGDVPGTEAVRVMAAPGLGDDTVVEQTAAETTTSRQVIVVTADRDLAERVRVLGAAVVGPRRLLDLL